MLLLVFPLGIVGHQGDGEGDDEQDRQRHQRHQQADDQRDRQGRVEPEQPGLFQGDPPLAAMGMERTVGFIIPVG